MNFIFQNEIIGEERRLVLNISEGMEVDQFALHMMNYNDIDYLVPVQIAQYNSRNYMQYDIAGLNTLGDKVASILKKSEVIQILNSIICAFEEVEAYMLSEKNLFLDLNYVFIDNKNKCNFIYVPLLQEVSNDKISFLHNLLECIQPDYTERDPYIFNILNSFSRGAITRLSDLKEMLRKNSSMVLQQSRETEPIEERAYDDLQSIKNEKPSEIGESMDVEPETEKKVSKGIPMVLNIPGKTGVALNIPGKANVASNIPEPIETKNERKKKEEKKRREIRLFGKKNVDNKENEKTYESTLKQEINVNKNMYEGYEQTVVLQRPPMTEDFFEGTICLESINQDVRLERSRTGESIKIRSANVVLGSGSAADCYIADNKAISRNHAVISMQDSRYYIADNNSSNGTWVNGRRLLPGNNVEITNETLIKLADEEFVFKL